MAAQMVTVGGVRYRVEDAIRLGLFPPPETKEAVKPQNKARRAPANKGKAVKE